MNDDRFVEFHKRMDDLLSEYADVLSGPENTIPVMVGWTLSVALDDASSSEHGGSRTAWKTNQMPYVTVGLLRLALIDAEDTVTSEDD